VSAIAQGEPGGDVIDAPTTPEAPPRATPRPRPPTPAPPTGPSSVRYLPGLDGLRGVAVIAVFLFHGGVGAVSGGYLAVSTFFTLSGFLITLLLLGELGARGRVAVGAFWERRIRRLLPAAALGVALAAVVTGLVGTGRQRNAIGADALATVADVANWRFVLAEQSYGQLFEAPSALQHAWSLAIEAQFYWIYPLLFIALMKLVGGRRRRFALGLVALFVASILLTRFGGFDADRIYYGTDTRAAELLAGAIVAALVANGAATGWATMRNGPRLALDLASVVAAGVLAASWVLTPAGASWLGTGGLGIYAGVSALVILGAAVPGTVLARALSGALLRGLGRISYGLYLFHWPILLLVAPGRIPGPGVLRLVVAAALTTGLAFLSYRFVEHPIRRRIAPFGRLAVGGVVALSLVVALVPSLLIARAAPPASASADVAPGTLLNDTETLGVAPEGAIDRTPASTAPLDPPSPARPTEALPPAPFDHPSRPLRVVVVGDSVAHELAPLLDGWGADAGVWAVASHARIGCGIVRGGATRGALVNPEFGPECSVWPDEWSRMLTVVQPDLVVLAGGFWDAIDRRMAPRDPWRAPGDATQDRLIVDEYHLALEVLTATGVPVAWLDHPAVVPSPTGVNASNPADYDPARMRRLDELQAEVVARHPGAQVVRTRAFLEAWPGGELDPELRPDGMHFSGAGAAPFIAWLGPELVNTYWALTATTDAP
jgi:peptidoglycan/LPS O-acetylase OafA/YrhL